jgi:peptidoglycan/xylan/chitin deacetylase (PgdA/CDA1 family)
VLERPQDQLSERSHATGTGLREGLPGPLPNGLGSSIRRARPRFGPKRPQRLLRSLLVLGIALSLTLGILLRGHAPVPPLRVQLQGKAELISPGSALKDVVQRFDLKPTAGDLVDVEGKVLSKGVFPGQILVNGAVVPETTPIHTGDVITLQPGKDKRERLVKQIIEIPGGQIPNPQFFLGTAPGEQVLLFGKTSGKLFSSVFKPTGAVALPNAVALTFDDGPSPDNTRKVLAVLKKFNVKATFFVIGRSASFHPAIVKDEIAAGMAVENHSWTHPYLTPFKTLPVRVIRDEINQTQAELLSLGATSTLFRPPGGTFSQRVIDLAKQADARVVMWSIDPKDWTPGRTAQQIAQAVLSHIRPGSIVILHDGGGDRSATIAALPAIIKGIRAKGLELVTLTAAA